MGKKCYTSMKEENCCEHGDHPAPAGKRFCSEACEICEHESGSENGCDGICFGFDQNQTRELHMSEETQQPERTANDGPVSLKRSSHLADEVLILKVAHAETTQEIHMTEYNAWRVFGMLALMLGIKLPNKLLKSIKL